MDQIVQQKYQDEHQSLQSSFQFRFQDKTYIASLQVIDYRLEITVMIEEQSHFQWKVLFSIEQSYKLHNFFLQCTCLQDVYEVFLDLMKQSIQLISISENNMHISFEFKYLLGRQTQFTIQLLQSEINTNEVLVKMSEKIFSNETKCNSKQIQLEQMIKDQSSQIEQMKDCLTKQIEEMKDILSKQIESLKEEHQNQIQELKKEINLKTFSNIILQEDFEIIKKWISDKQINLQQIYRASIHGFSIEKIYEQCKSKQKVVLLIKTIENKRFGFYSDLEITNSNGSFISQNPNNIFLFSLDLKQKYTSNESNCQYAFKSNSSCLAVGGGHDILLYSNSNSNKTSYVSSHSYGKKEGLTGHALNGGTREFTTSEVEIFEITGI
ncbi:hypothetical protein ABPG72_017760 [Tetrahymena utriculariae]